MLAKTVINVGLERIRKWRVYVPCLYTLSRYDGLEARKISKLKTTNPLFEVELAVPHRAQILKYVRVINREGGL